jgi:uncharacterized lipoprotein YajG
MKTTSANRLLLFSCVTLLTGCAFTKETVQVTFQPPVFPESVSADAVIVVQKLKDARGMDPHLLAHKGVQMKTTGAYVTDLEVADIVTDALKETLKSLKYRTADDTGALTLSGDIVKFDSAVIMGFWAGAMESSIQLNLKLTDAKTGALLWAELLSGYTKIDGLQVDRAAHRQRVAEEALQDVMKKLGESDSFKKVVQNYAPK